MYPPTLQQLRNKEEGCLLESGHEKKEEEEQLSLLSQKEEEGVYGGGEGGSSSVFIDKTEEGGGAKEQKRLFKKAAWKDRAGFAKGSTVSATSMRTLFREMTVEKRLWEEAEKMLNSVLETRLSLLGFAKKVGGGGGRRERGERE